jgi:hypothetical protein
MNEISIGISIWDMGYRFGIRCIDMVIYHIDMVILDIDMGDEANDMGDASIDTVISHIDMGYLVTLAPPPPPNLHQMPLKTGRPDRGCCVVPNPSIKLAQSSYQFDF